MKIIKVDKICSINQDNIAPCREERIIGINITQKIKNEKKFINYCLAIQDIQSCCERYGAGMLKVVSFDEDNVFVDRIEHDVKGVTVQWLNDNGFKYDWDKYEASYIANDSIVTKVYGKDDKLLVIGWVYNYHNGYYSHEVYTDINKNINVIQL